MKEKKKSWTSYMYKWAMPFKDLYIKSLILAIVNVVLKMLPYFYIADIVKMYINGNKNFNDYFLKAILIMLCFILAELFHSVSTMLSHKATFEVIADIRKKCCDKLARVPLRYVKDKPSGTFKNIIVERIDSIETTLAHIVPEFTSNLLAPIFILIYFFVVDYRLALWALLPIAIGFMSYGGMMIDFKPNFERTVKATSDLNNAAVEYIDGIEVIKAFSKTQSSYEKFTNAAKEYANSFISWMAKCAKFHASMMTITPYTLLTVLPFGAHYVDNGTLLLSDFIVCIILSLGIVGPLITIGSYTDDLGKIDVVVKEIADILDCEELQRPIKSLEVPKDNSVSLIDVKFAYKDKEVLHGINMEIKNNTINAIVGPSGSGKSTIAKLIASFWDVKSGTIEIGGVDIRNLALDDYNNKIAYVSQDNYLFNETIKENIRYGKPGLSDEEIVEITKKSGCYEFIMSLENGFNTIAGDAGSHLSGGERQRICIARAMAKDAPIIILDEATAYSDPENEAILQSSIAKLVKDKTLIVIAHRLSTIKDSDCIFVVNDGHIEGYGKHEELLNSCRLYREMWSAHVYSKDLLGGSENV